MEVRVDFDALRGEVAEAYGTGYDNGWKNGRRSVRFARKSKIAHLKALLNDARRQYDSLVDQLDETCAELEDAKARLGFAASRIEQLEATLPPGHVLVR